MKKLLVAVIAVAIGVLYFENPWQVKEGDVLHEQFFKKFDREEIARIEMEQLMSAVQLKRTEAGWEVNELRSAFKQELDKKESNESPKDGPRWYPVEEERIDMSLSALEDLTITSLAGKNPNRHSFFEVDDTTGLHVRGFNKKGETVFHCIIGKTGPDYMNNYVRKEKENEVYLSRSYLKSSFPLDVDGWRRRTLWTIPPDSIEKIVIKRQNGEETLTKENKEWVNLLNQVANLKAQSFVDDPNEQTGLQNSSLTISIISNVGASTLHLGKKTASNAYYGQKEGDPQVYILRASLTEAIEKTLK